MTKLSHDPSLQLGQSPKTGGPQRILLVDDHPIILLALSSLINEDPQLEVCGQASTCSEALDLVEQQKPDLMIVDIALSDGSGLQLIKRLKSRHEDLRFLVVSMRNEELYAERALMAGAMGYINKREVTDRVLTAVHRVLEGRVYLSEHMTERMLQGMVEHHSSTEPSISKLSNRELEVFDMIGQGLSTSAIAEELKLSIKTIETHREKIKKKLGIGSSNELSRYAMQWYIEES